MLVVAVSWHRHVIRGDPLAPSMALPHLGVLLYALWAVLLHFFGLLATFPAGITTLVLGSVLSTLSTAGQDQNWVPALLFVGIAMAVLASALIYLTVTTRLVLVLPAVAGGGAVMTLGRAWDLTRGNTWRLIALVMLLGIWVALGFALGSALAAIVEPAPSISSTAVFLLVMVLIYFNVAGTASLLSAVYLRLARPEVKPARS